jgi:hypothetical protein
LERHPEWIDFLSADEHEVDGLVEFTGRISIPSQNPSYSDNLQLYIDSEQLLYIEWFRMPSGSVWSKDFIYCSTWMRGRTPKGFGGDQEEFESYLICVERILEESYVAHVHSSKQKGDGGSYGLWLASEIDAHIGKEMPGFGVIRSWKGTYDAEYQI